MPSLMKGELYRKSRVVTGIVVSSYTHLGRLKVSCCCQLNAGMAQNTMPSVLQKTQQLHVLIDKGSSLGYLSSIE